MRAARAGVMAGARLGGAVAVFVVALSGVAGARPAISPQDLDIPVMVQSVPAIEGLHFSLSGRAFSSDRHGLALITVDSPGTYELSFEAAPDPVDGTSARFTGWKDLGTQPSLTLEVERFVLVEAGFALVYPIEIEVVDPGGTPYGADLLGPVEVADDRGATTTLDPAGALALDGVTAVATPDGLEARRLTYEARSVDIGGAEIKEGLRPSFTPATDEGPWRLVAPTHVLVVEAGDAVTSSPVAAEIGLTGPGGRRLEVALGPDGRAALEALPPGRYQLDIRSGGLSSTRAVEVPGTSRVRFDVVTPADGAGAAVLLALLVGATVVVGSRRARAALASPLRRRRTAAPRPTPTVEAASGGPPSPRSPPRPALTPPPPPPGRESVRVHLLSGRVIEGRRSAGGPTEERVVVVDVDRVFDRRGEETPATPGDSFVPASQIFRIERPGAPRPAGASVIRLDDPRAGPPPGPDEVDVRESPERAGPEAPAAPGSPAPSVPRREDAG